MNKKKVHPNFIQKILSLFIKKAFLRRINRINRAIKNPIATQNTLVDSFVDFSIRRYNVGKRFQNLP
jgi:hypothetical protein